MERDHGRCPLLKILGSRKTLCDGLTRRDFLTVRGLGLGSLGLNSLLPGSQAQATTRQVARAHSFGKAKSVILLFLYGGASQLETFDVKPEAPVEIRGRLGSIPTNVTGY